MCIRDSDQLALLVEPALGVDPRLEGRRCHVSQEVRARVDGLVAVSYTHLRAHETVLDLVCRLLLEKKKNKYK